MRMKKAMVLLIIIGVLLGEAAAGRQVYAHTLKLHETMTEKKYKVELIEEEVPLADGAEENSEGKAFAFYVSMTTICLGILYYYEKRAEKEKKLERLEKEAAQYLRKDLIIEKEI